MLLETCLTLTDFARLAQVIIALISLLLAYYILVYNRNKDKNSEIKSERLRNQNIKLQWFKELVIQPNLILISTFYDNLLGIEGMISSNELNDQEKEKINSFIKSELKDIRIKFVDLLLLIDKEFRDKLLDHLDDLIDELTNAIYNDELKLNLPQVYEREISSKIHYSRNRLLSFIYNYKGVKMEG